MNTERNNTFCMPSVAGPLCRGRRVSPPNPAAAAVAICLFFTLIITLPSSVLALEGGNRGREGQLVPVFTVVTVGGEQFDLRQRVKGGTVVVLFWNSHMSMSIRAIKFLNSMSEYYHPYGFEVVGIESNGNDINGVRQELDKLEVIGSRPRFPVISDPEGRLSRQYGINAVPELFIVNRQGMILFHLQGFSADDSVVAENSIKEILGLLPAPTDLPDRPLSKPGIKGVPARKKVVTVDPEAELYGKYQYFGNYYYNLGNLEKALENYLKCLDIRPTSIETHLKVGEVYAVMKNYEEARESWETVLRLAPDNREADVLIRKLIRGEY